MVNLILDCSCGMNVYVIQDEKIFSRINTTQNKHSDEILLVVDELLAQAKISVNQIDNIGVCIGPGSFTGVRVAISLAKGLAIGSQAKVFVLSNFEIFNVENRFNSCLVLDGFSSFVYARFFDGEKCVDECIDLNQLSELVKKERKHVFVTTEKLKMILQTYQVDSELLESSIVNSFARHISKGQDVKLNQIFPVYLRASQAEIEREKKLKNG